MSRCTLSDAVHASITHRVPATLTRSMAGFGFGVMSTKLAVWNTVSTSLSAPSSVLASSMLPQTYSTPDTAAVAVVRVLKVPWVATGDEHEVRR